MDAGSCEVLTWEVFSGNPRLLGFISFSVIRCLTKAAQGRRGLFQLPTPGFGPSLQGSQGSENLKMLVTSQSQSETEGE